MTNKNKRGTKRTMKTKERKYWYEQLDRLGLLFGGMFIGALMELTGITHLGIIVSVALITATIILMFLLKYKITITFLDAELLK